MANTYRDIQGALTGSLVALNSATLDSLPVGFHMRDFNPETVTGAVFLLESYLFDQQSALDKQGLDEVRGIYQVSVYLRSGEPVATINTIIDAIISNYTHNKSFVYNSQKIVIINAGRNGGTFQNGWYAVDVSINFKSDILRA